MIRAAGLTEREYSIAAVAARGISLEEVAAACGWTRGSVKVWLCRRVYPKLGVRNQTELVRYWADHVEPATRCSHCLLRQAHLIETIETNFAKGGVLPEGPADCEASRPPGSAQDNVDLPL